MHSVQLPTISIMSLLSSAYDSLDFSPYLSLMQRTSLLWSNWKKSSVSPAYNELDSCQAQTSGIIYQRLISPNKLILTCRDINGLYLYCMGPSNTTPFQGGIADWMHIPKQQLRYFTIASKSSGRVLDLCQDGDNKGKLIIYDSWGAQNQQFGIVHISPLEVLLVNRTTGLCLTVANNSDKNGAVIVEEPPNNLASQRFRLQEISPSSGEYVIFTYSGKALDCCENETKNNTRIIQWDFHAKDNQKWLLTRV